jgi:hypothetical protein
MGGTRVKSEIADCRLLIAELILIADLSKSNQQSEISHQHLQNDL